MEVIDWLIVFAYLLGMLGLAARLGQTQNSRKDYFLGGNRMSPLSLAASTMATQCSTNSLLGAPAFVGFVAGGGLLWLQYELAVPLAMLLLIPLLGSIRRRRFVSVYGYLEERLGRRTRVLASSAFLVFRGVATGVTVYGVASVVTLLLNVSYTQAVVLLMGVTIAYDLLGGMRAVVVSDVLQLVLIVVAVLCSLGVLIATIDGGSEAIIAHAMETDRLSATQLSWGVSGEGNYGFWPMLLGGLFLYMAYYGCDQSQAQRVLASRSASDAERVLLLNGLLRFPVVLLYCLLGLALAAFAEQTSDFIDQLPLTAASEPNYNLVFPVFVLQTFPAGMVGLVMVGIFAAAMSSIDSSLNALAAATVEDFADLSGKTERTGFILAKISTFSWGVVAVAFSYCVETIAPTVLEAINKIGSMTNGSLLAIFVLALLAPGMKERAPIAGFVAGLVANVLVWLILPQVSWLWWNVIGFVVAVTVALALGQARILRPDYLPNVLSIGGLLLMALLILGVCIGLSL